MMVIIGKYISKLCREPARLAIHLLASRVKIRLTGVHSYDVIIFVQFIFFLMHRSIVISTMMRRLALCIDLQFTLCSRHHRTDFPLRPSLQILDLPLTASNTIGGQNQYGVFDLQSRIDAVETSCFLHRTMGGRSDEGSPENFVSQIQTKEQIT